MILLDTNVVIAFFNGSKAVLERVHSEIDRIALSTLVVAELDYGAKACTIMSADTTEIIVCLLERSVDSAVGAP